MPGIEEKLQSFSAIVLENANKQNEKKRAELEKEKDKLIDEKETELLEDAYEDIQKSVIQSRRENSERILKAEMDMKKELIMQREQIIDKVFDDVEQKLMEFAASPEYECWLVKRAAAAAAEIGEGSKDVYVSNKDIKFKSALEKGVGGIKVCGTDEDFIGGVRVINTDKNICVNYSMKDMLEEKRGTFLRESGLSIY